MRIIFNRADISNHNIKEVDSAYISEVDNILNEDDWLIATQYEKVKQLTEKCEYCIQLINGKESEYYLYYSNIGHLKEDFEYLGSKGYISLDNVVAYTIKSYENESVSFVASEVIGIKRREF